MKIFVIVLLFISVWLPQTAHSQQQRFDEATQMFQEQRVEEAFEIYRSLETEEALSGKLFYNMGLAAVYMDSLGLAKYYFMQALDYPDVSSDAESAINYVDNRFNRRSAVLPELPWDRLLSWLTETYGAVWVMAGGIILFNIGMAGIIASWFLPRLSIWLRKGGYAGVCFAILFMLTSLLLDYREDRYRTGVMVHNEAVVREQPLEEASAVNTAWEGYVMRVDLKRSDNEQEWFHVRLENGMYGWIQRDGVRVF